MDMHSATVVRGLWSDKDMDLPSERTAACSLSSASRVMVSGRIYQPHGSQDAGECCESLHDTGATLDKIYEYIRHWRSCNVFSSGIMMMRDLHGRYLSRWALHVTYFGLTDPRHLRLPSNSGCGADNNCEATIMRIRENRAHWIRNINWCEIF